MNFLKKDFMVNFLSGIAFVTTLCAGMLLLDYTFFDGALVGGAVNTNVGHIKMRLQTLSTENDRLKRAVQTMDGEIKTLRLQKGTLSQEEERIASLEIQELRKSLEEALLSIKRLEEEKRLLEASLKELLEMPENKFLMEMDKIIFDTHANIKAHDGKLIFKDAVSFPTASTALTEEAKHILDDVAVTIQDIAARVGPENPWVLKVMGHADQRTLKNPKPFSSNWILASARAVSIIKYLTKKGIDPNRLSAAGLITYKAKREKASTDTLARDRRAILSIDRKVQGY